MLPPSARKAEPPMKRPAGEPRTTKIIGRIKSCIIGVNQVPEGLIILFRESFPNHSLDFPEFWSAFVRTQDGWGWDQSRGPS